MQRSRQKSASSALQIDILTPVAEVPAPTRERSSSSVASDADIAASFFPPLEHATPPASAGPSRSSSLADFGVHRRTRSEAGLSWADRFASKTAERTSPRGSLWSLGLAADDDEDASDEELGTPNSYRSRELVPSPTSTRASTASPRSKSVPGSPVEIRRNRSLPEPAGERVKVPHRSATDSDHLGTDEDISDFIGAQASPLFRFVSLALPSLGDDGERDGSNQPTPIKRPSSWLRLRSLLPETI